MCVRNVASAVLLFAAAAGWSCRSLPTPADDHLSAVRKGFERLGVHVLPPVCVAAGIGLILAGFARPDPATEPDE